MGMQVAFKMFLKCSYPLVKGFSLFCLKVTVTQQLAYLILEMVHAFRLSLSQQLLSSHLCQLCLTAESELMLSPNAKQ